MKVKEQVTQIHLDKEESEIWQRVLDMLERMERQVRETKDEDLYERVGRAIAAMQNIHIFHIVLDGEDSECQMRKDIFINSALFALVLIYGFNTLVFWATSKVRFAVAAITGLIQPVLIMTMYILITFLFIDTSFIGPVIFQVIIKAAIAAIIFVLAIYAFIKVIASPFKKNLGIGVLDLLSLFIAHMNEGSNSLEGLFENMSEAIETVVTFVSFKTETLHCA